MWAGEGKRVQLRAHISKRAIEGTCVNVLAVTSGAAAPETPKKILDKYHILWYNGKKKGGFIMKQKHYRKIKRFLKREMENNIENRGYANAMHEEKCILEGYKDCEWYTLEEMARSIDREIEKKMIDKRTIIYKWEKKYYNEYIKGLLAIQKEVIKWQKEKK